MGVGAALIVEDVVKDPRKVSKGCAGSEVPLSICSSAYSVVLISRVLCVALLPLCLLSP